MKTLVLLPRWVPNSITLLNTPMLANLVCTPLFKHARTVNALLVDAFLHTSSCLPSGPLKWGGSFATSLKINSILLWHHLSIFLPPFPTNPHHFYSPKTLCILPLNFRCCLHKINLFFHGIQISFFIKLSEVVKLLSLIIYFIKKNKFYVSYLDIIFYLEITTIKISLYIFQSFSMTTNQNHQLYIFNQF